MGCYSVIDNLVVCEYVGAVAATIIALTTISDETRVRGWYGCCEYE